MAVLGLSDLLELFFLCQTDCKTYKKDLVHLVLNLGF